MSQPQPQRSDREGEDGQRRANPEIVPEADLDPARRRPLHDDQVGDRAEHREIAGQGYVCTVGDRLYAFEHTGIEPFDNQIEMEVRNRTLFGPIVERFDEKGSDPEFWELCVPVEASVGLRGAERR
jgi:hypothetical protein